MKLKFIKCHRSYIKLGEQIFIYTLDIPRTYTVMTREFQKFHTIQGNFMKNRKIKTVANNIVFVECETQPVPIISGKPVRFLWGLNRNFCWICTVGQFKKSPLSCVSLSKSNLIKEFRPFQPRFKWTLLWHVKLEILILVETNFDYPLFYCLFRQLISWIF